MSRVNNKDFMTETIYAINNEMQVEINQILKLLKVQTRKKQNIKSIKVEIVVDYFEETK